MLEMTEEILQQIKAHGAAAYPYEGCGLLLGQRTGDTNQAVAIFPVENRWEVEEEKRVRFAIAPEDMLRAELDAARQDLGVIGVFHSHPDDAPVASPRDLAWAAWSGYSYLITEVRNGEPGQSRSWQLRADRSGFVEESVRIR
jgi:proteasome lid subunit RPN8/RPN11